MLNVPLCVINALDGDGVRREPLRLGWEKCYVLYASMTSCDALTFNWTEYHALRAILERKFYLKWCLVNLMRRVRLTPRVYTTLRFILCYISGAPLCNKPFKIFDC